MRTPTLADVETRLARAWDTGDTDAAAYWTKWVDQLDPATQRAAASLHGAALWYTRHGYHVFPLTPGHKHPIRGSHGLHDATLNPDQVHAWWTRWPDANIGIATGHNIDVVDIDGPTGNHALAQDTDLLDDLRKYTQGHVSTPRPGGRHLYIPADPDLRNGTALAPGVDYRGAGGYVVAPPSRIREGGKDTPGTYRWITPPGATPE